MEVKQVYTLVNSVTEETLGETGLIQEDLQGVVDLGDTIANRLGYDKYVKSLVNHIGKVIFVNRVYRGGVPSVLMDGWEFGSICEKVTAELPDATENESWELTNGSSYDPNIFYQPTVSAKFFNKRVTFEIPMSFTELQVKQSFSSAEQLNAFISMLYNAVEKSLTVKIDGLIMRTINNMIGETLYAEVPGGVYGGRTGVKAINLLYEYNTEFSKTLTANKCLTDKDFIRFAVNKMGIVANRMTKISTLFNVGGKDRFTSPDLLHVVLLSDLKNGADTYLQSGTFHQEYTALPNAEQVPYWQGSGTSYGFNDITKIKIKTSSNHAIETSGILGIMFDRDALGVTNLDRRVTSNYNPKAEFFTNWYKFDAGYFNDLNENFVVFYVADAPAQ